MASANRGTALAPARARRLPPVMTWLFSLLLVASVAGVGWNIWTIVQAPGHPLNYVLLAWGLLVVAFPTAVLLRSEARLTTLILISGNLSGVAINLWSAAQAPADWVNYFTATCLALLLLTWWLVSRWVRTRRA